MDPSMYSVSGHLILILTYCKQLNDHITYISTTSRDRYYEAGAKKSISIEPVVALRSLGLSLWLDVFSVLAQSSGTDGPENKPAPMST